jgi:ATP-dependent Lhr-like helicase
VRGLAGAQFALPEAVEELRAAPPASPTAIAMAAGDPANAFALPLAGDVERDPLTVGRGAGAILVTIAGLPILAADGRGHRVRVRPGAAEAQITAAARALVERVTARHARRRDVIVETIDGERASTSPHAAAFLAAGFRLTTAGLRWYAG